MYYYRHEMIKNAKLNPEKDEKGDEYHRKRNQIFQEHEYKRSKSVTAILLFSLFELVVFLILSENYCFAFADIIATQSLFVFVIFLAIRLVTKKIHSIRMERRRSDLNVSLGGLADEYKSICPQACLDYLRQFGCGDKNSCCDPVCSVDLSPLSYYEFENCRNNKYHCYNCPKLNNVFWDD